MAQKQYSSPLTKSDLIFRHIDRMSERLNQPMEYSASGQILYTYFYNVQHMENILTDVLDKKYKEVKEDIFKGIDFADIGQKPSITFAFFRAVSRWFQLLYIYSISTGAIKDKKKFFAERREYFTGEN